MHHPLLLQGLRSLGHQGWLPFGVRDRVLRRFVAPDPRNHWPFEVDFFGLRYRGTLASFIDWEVFFYGAYEKGDLDFLGRVLSTLPRAGRVVLDIGANAGHHTLFFARQADVVHSFEPWDAVASQLRQRLADNLLSHVRLHPLGLGLVDEELPFHAPEGANLGTGSFLADHSPDNRPLSRLSVRNGDRYLAEQGIERIDFVKIDVEGFELNALRGLAQTLARTRPVLWVEFSASTAREARAQGGFEKAFPEGYRLLTVHTRKGPARLRPFDPEDVSGNVLAVPAERSAVLSALA